MAYTYLFELQNKQLKNEAVWTMYLLSYITPHSKLWILFFHIALRLVKYEWRLELLSLLFKQQMVWVPHYIVKFLRTGFFSILCVSIYCSAYSEQPIHILSVRDLKDEYMFTVLKYNVGQLRIIPFVYKNFMNIYR